MSPEASRARELFRGAESSAFIKEAYNYFGRAGWSQDPRRAMDSNVSSGEYPGGSVGFPGGEGGAVGAPTATGEPAGAPGEAGETPWWQKGLTGLGYAGVAASLPTLIRGVQSPTGALATAAKGGKLMKGVGYLGTAMGAYGDLKGAVTGDQGYESEGFLGQLGEQGLRTGGNLGSALMTGNPYAVMGAGLASAANVGKNLERAAGAVWDTTWNGGWGNKGAVKGDEIAALKSRRAKGLAADAKGSTAGSVGVSKL